MKKNCWHWKNEGKNSEASTSQGCMASTSEDEDIVKKMRDLEVMKAQKIMANVYLLLGDTLQEANAMVASASQEEVVLP